MRKTTLADQMRLLGQYEQRCGEMPPADLMDPETSKLFINELLRRHSKPKIHSKTKRQ
ncbi:MAG: hypothetical protein HQL80_07545 [Magnetococcales bacterium]|nr:hypothetical protein [Magnetococcales bacterium]